MGEDTLELHGNLIRPVLQAPPVMVGLDRLTQALSPLLGGYHLAHLPELPQGGREGHGRGQLHSIHRPVKAALMKMIFIVLQ